ncbi:MAG: transglutaminase family protein [Puniceicoccaceae bacterium]
MAERSKNKKIGEVAERVERILDDQGTILTMGGEPTLVPLRPVGEEWNNAAMGPEKLGYARRFARAMLESDYNGALVMQIFGKWYPGEVLPRWNLMLLDPLDGSDLWSSREHLMLDDRHGANTTEIGALVALKIAEVVDLGDFLIPAWENEESLSPTGWVLPLDRVEGNWVSDRWLEGAEDKLTLFAGDSPVGLRIPLGELEEDALKRALTVATREGCLEVFIPPLEVSAFLDLIGRIERVLDALRIRDVVFCGYLPHGAAEELDLFGIAADPGVIEVNLPPRRTWVGFEQILKAATEAGSQVGLVLTKTSLNGAVGGSGGGAHLAFGGPSLEENPFLKQPARIASLLRYWQHHPVLSYAFTGKFVGPGSQAPRIDEGPRHGLYELEVACEGLEKQTQAIEGPLIDQFLRNLATDSAGNTHRAEICFDKFFNGLAKNGKLGIIEFRAFETFPSDGEMAEVALFIRAVLARLFLEPFSEPLKRFGPDLHDRYFLPSLLWEDLEAICADLRSHGIPFEADWLRSQFDFRFPVCGKLEAGEAGILTLRQGLESWPLMAEESLELNTIRMVDNSTDRLEIMLEEGGLEKGWSKLLVNGIEVPFQTVEGKRIAGLRYKCASAYPALHPHVPIQSPLHFDWVDSRIGKVVAAANYYFWEPWSGIYAGPCEDLNDARKRRESRWVMAPERVGTVPKAAKPRMSPEYNFTLDLRRQSVA